MILKGDVLASEYLLINLISKVYKRDAALLIGDININLSHLNEVQASLLKKVISAVFPLVCHFNATIDSMSNSLFNPKKNYDTNLME